MTTYPNMGLTLPTRGAPGAGLWGDTDDANWAKVDAHDHSSGKGTQVPTAGLNINADLTFSGLYAPIALNRVSFSSVASPSTNKSLFVADGTGGTTANELYWRSSTGTNVKITAGSSLNVSAFTGGFTGDYTAVSAVAAYVDSTKFYTFKQGGGVNWAGLQSGGLRLLERGTSESVFVEQNAPAALAASYTVTWPLALPASAQAITVDNTGAMSVGASFSLSANNSITLSGTGDLKHGTRTLQIPVLFAGSNPWNNGTPANGSRYGISLKNGDRITAVRARIQDNATGPTKITIALQSVADGAATTVSTSAQSAGSGANQTLAVTGLASTIASGTNYQMLFTIATGAAAVILFWIEVDYDRP